MSRTPCQQCGGEPLKEETLAAMHRKIRMWQDASAAAQGRADAMAALLRRVVSGDESDAVGLAEEIRAALARTP